VQGFGNQNYHWLFYGGDVFHRINPLAFALSQVGNLALREGRNPFIGPINSTDLSLQTTVAVRERLSLQLRLDAFNAFNHPQFTGINSNIIFKSITGGDSLKQYCEPG